MVTNRGSSVKLDIPGGEEGGDQPGLIEKWRQHYKEEANKTLMQKWREHYEQNKDSPDRYQTAFKVTVAVLLFQAPTMLYIFFSYIIPYLFEEYDYWTQYTLKVISVYCWIQLCLNFCFCYLYDTGIRKTKDRPDVPGTRNDWSCPPPDHFVARLEDTNGHLKNGHLNDDGAELKYCEKCEIYKPPRAHHCKLCNQCILLRDHHCYIVGCCIGYKNQRYFVILTFYVAMMGLFGGMLTYQYLRLIFWPMAQSWTDLVLPVSCYRWFLGTIQGHHLLMIYQLYIEILYGGMCFLFFNLQLSLIAKGMTMYEVAKQVPIKVNTSINTNFVSVFGHFWMLNFIFPMQMILRQVGDGTKWEGVKLLHNLNYEKNVVN